MSTPFKITSRWFVSKWAIGFYIASAICVAFVVFDIMDPTEAIALEALVLGCFVVYHNLPTGYSIAWPKQVSQSRDGSRDEIVHLAWLLFGKDRNVSFGGMKRIREGCANVFDSVGIDLKDPHHQRYLESQLSEGIVAALEDTDRMLSQNQARRLTKFLTNIEAFVKANPLPPTTPHTYVSHADTTQGDN